MNNSALRLDNTRVTPVDLIAIPWKSLQRRMLSMHTATPWRWLSLLLELAAPHVRAATNDVTGLTPTMHMTFNTSSHTHIDNGTATLASESLDGTTPTYKAAPNGMAMHAGKMLPYYTVNNLTQDNQAYTVSTYTTLGAIANGIVWSLRTSKTSPNTTLILRRGAQPNEVVVTTSDTSQPVIALQNLNGGDHTFHHYAIVVEASGMTLYIDGHAKAFTSATEIRLRDKMQFGRRTGGLKDGEANGDALLDDFRVYNTALSQAQIMALCQELSSKASDPGSISISTGVRQENPGDILHLETPKYCRAHLSEDAKTLLLYKRAGSLIMLH